MATARNVEQTAREIVCRVMGKPPEQVTLAAGLVADLGLQSIDFIELYESLDQAFNVDIDDEANEIQTFGDLVRYIERRLASGSREPEEA